jgi:hypothetical protein
VLLIKDLHWLWHERLASPPALYLTARLNTSWEGSRLAGSSLSDFPANCPAQDYSSLQMRTIQFHLERRTSRECGSFQGNVAQDTGLH